MRARIVDEARILSCICFPQSRNDALSQYANDNAGHQAEKSQTLCPLRSSKILPPGPFTANQCTPTLPLPVFLPKARRTMLVHKFPGIVGNACLSCAQCFTPSTPCRRIRFRVPRSKQNPKQCRVDSLSAQRCLLLFGPDPPRLSFD